MLWLLLTVWLSPSPNPAPDLVHTQGRTLRIHYELDARDSVPAIGVALLARRPGGPWTEVAHADVGGELRFRPEEEGVWHLSAVGLGDDGSREAPGEAPEAIVIVDRTAPGLEIESVEPESGDGSVVRWVARDPHLARKPVGVHLALGPFDASWRADRAGRIVLSEPPSGQRWTVRLVARDRAGNRTEEVFHYPATPEVRHVGVDLAAAGEMKDARADGEPAAASEGPGSYRRGRSLLSRGLTRQAIEELQRVVASAPLHARAWNDLGVALARLGKSTPAAEAFARAARATPHLPVAERNLALTGGAPRTAPSGPPVQLAGGR